MAARTTRWLTTEAPYAGGDSESLFNADAHDLAMRAWSLQYHAAPGVSREARSLLEQALQLDPKSAFTWAGVAHLHISDLATRHTDDWNASIASAVDAAARAVELEPQMVRGLLALAQARAYQGRLEESLELLDRLMLLNPNVSVAYQWQGISHLLMGNARLAIRPFETCIELSPRDRRLSTLTRNLALSWLHLGEDEKGLQIAERSIHQHPIWPRSYETLAMAYAVCGLMEDARATVDVLLKHWPGYTIAQHRVEMMSTRAAFLVQRERLLDGLRASGLPER
jgi:adenylate cyclase